MYFGFTVYFCIYEQYNTRCFQKTSKGVNMEFGVKMIASIACTWGQINDTNLAIIILLQDILAVVPRL